MSEQLIIPDNVTLMAELIELGQRVDSIGRYLAAFNSGRFLHPDGRTDSLGTTTLKPMQAAMISYLCKRCPTPLSMEVGFGMGTSASVILGTRRFLGQPFEHIVFDPFGLSNGRGSIVESYLVAEYGNDYRRIHKRSEVGLGQLLDERGDQMAGLIFVDGSHHFEHVMTDFVLASLLCCEGGFIILDDACYPAIETVVNYVRTNRKDYAVAHLAAPNLTVMKKVTADHREWSDFEPFRVPNRRNWTTA